MRSTTLKLLALIVIATSIAIAPASACQGPQFERHILLSAPPVVDKSVEFVGKVSVRAKSKWVFFKQDAQSGFFAKISESSTHPYLIGTTIELPPVTSTSCGPWLKVGDQGYIAGNFFLQTVGRMKLIPMSHSGMDVLFPTEEQEPLDLHGSN